MAKRHHSKHHMSEHEHREHKIHGGHYEGHNPRRRQEMEDAGMISEDHSAIANMPQNVIMKNYPTENDYTPENLDDTISGIERQKGMDYSKMRQHLMPKKV
jgi:hypothetical protein